MTAQRLVRRDDAVDDPLVGSADPVEAARQHLAETTLRADAGGRVGLELEHHLVDLAHPDRRPTWDDVTALVEAARHRCPRAAR